MLVATKQASVHAVKERMNSLITSKGLALRLVGDDIPVILTKGKGHEITSIKDGGAWINIMLSNGVQLRTELIKDRDQLLEWSASDDPLYTGLSKAYGQLYGPASVGIYVCYGKLNAPYAEKEIPSRTHVRCQV